MIINQHKFIVNISMLAIVGEGKCRFNLDSEHKKNKKASSTNLFILLEVWLHFKNNNFVNKRCFPFMLLKDHK